MNHLKKELAPIGERAWALIEEEARRTLKAYLAARKLVEFDGPKGWEFSSIPLGRVESLVLDQTGGVETAVRRSQPLIELRSPFEVAQTEIEAMERGAEDPDLQGLVQAAQSLALLEDRLVFEGLEITGIRGIFRNSDHRPIPLTREYLQYPHAVAGALNVLREAGVDGPYALALGPECFTGLSRTAGSGGYPVLQHVKKLIEGPVIQAPSLDGALLLSLRGGDFELVVGQDIAIGFRDYDASRVRLYLEESLTFRLLGPEAAVPLRYQDA